MASSSNGTHVDQHLESPNAIALPRGVLNRQSSSASVTSRRSSSVHRSPMLSAQTDANLPQRFSNTQQDKQDMLNAMEAEEEALVNNLSRKLEQLRAEKVELESTLEMEQEALVNRLQRRLSELLSQQQLHQALGHSSSSTSSDPASPGPQEATMSPIPRPNFAPYFANNDPSNPSPAVLLDALQTENTSLRERLADVESTSHQIEQMNELYRLELIQLRERAGLDTADLTSMPITETVSRPRSGSTRIGALGGPVNTAATAAIRIPGAPYYPSPNIRSVSKSSYSPSASSALSMNTPYSASPATNVTTPSTSYTTPQAPASTPVGYTVSLSSTRNDAISGASTPYGSVTSSTSSVDTNHGMTLPAYRVPPPSMASSLGAGDAPTPSLLGIGDSRRIMAASPIQETLESGSSSRSSSPQALRMRDNYSPESLQRRLSASRQGARVAETGFLKKRTPSGNLPSIASEASSEVQTP